MASFEFHLKDPNINPWLHWSPNILTSILRFIISEFWITMISKRDNSNGNRHFLCIDVHTELLIDTTKSMWLVGLRELVYIFVIYKDWLSSRISTSVNAFTSHCPNSLRRREHCICASVTSNRWTEFSSLLHSVQNFSIYLVTAVLYCL